MFSVGIIAKICLSAFFGSLLGVFLFLAAICGAVIKAARRLTGKGTVTNNVVVQKKEQ